MMGRGRGTRSWSGGSGGWRSKRGSGRRRARRRCSWPGSRRRRRRRALGRGRRRRCASAWRSWRAAPARQRHPRCRRRVAGRVVREKEGVVRLAGRWVGLRSRNRGAVRQGCVSVPCVPRCPRGGDRRQDAPHLSGNRCKHGHDHVARPHQGFTPLTRPPCPHLSPAPYSCLGPAHHTFACVAPTRLSTFSCTGEAQGPGLRCEWGQAQGPGRRREWGQAQALEQALEQAPEQGA